MRPRGSIPLPSAMEGTHGWRVELPRKQQVGESRPEGSIPSPSSSLRSTVTVTERPHKPAQAGSTPASATSDAASRVEVRKRGLGHRGVPRTQPVRATLPSTHALKRYTGRGKTMC